MVGWLPLVVHSASLALVPQRLLRVAVVFVVLYKLTHRRPFLTLLTAWLVVGVTYYALVYGPPSLALRMQYAVEALVRVLRFKPVGVWFARVSVSILLKKVWW